MSSTIALLHKFKYELLLLALIQRLVIGIFLSDLDFYTTVIWSINVLLAIGIPIFKYNLCYS